MIAANNPFNIRFNKRNNWLGQIGQKRGFCEFDSINHGVRAAFVLIKGYIERDIDTPRKIINRFAPPKENDTIAYLDFVCLKCTLGVSRLEPDKQVSNYDDLFFLLKRMAWFESHTKLSENDIMEYCKFSKEALLNPIKLF